MGKTTEARTGSAEAFLGVDGGGTKTVGAYECGPIRRRVDAGPGNLRLLSDAQLLALFQAMRSAHDGLPEPAEIAIGMASARLEADRQRIRKFASKVWPKSRCHPYDDLQTALAAAEADAARARAPQYEALIVTLAGTGSCFFGKNSRGDTVKVGGWGHILGDDGGAYAIGLQAMRAMVWEFDREGKLPELGRRLLRALQVNKPEEVSAWAVNATKSDVGALAVEVAAAARNEDRIARRILSSAAEHIATEAVTCAGRLVPRKAAVRFVFTGSVLVKNSDVARHAARLIRERWRGATIATLETESAWGAVELARRHAAPSQQRSENLSGRAPADAKKDPIQTLDANLTASPTEQRNPRSMRLDKLPIRKAIELMASEDERIPAAILTQKAHIEKVIQWIVSAFQNGGRLFYVGAGTSGRLGVLDASECPPTFRTDPDLVQGIIAGGQTALWRAAEGAEDDPAEGARVIESRGIRKQDVVVGIAASGRTPFVWGALREAKRRGSKTVLLTFNPHLVIPRELKPDAVVAPDVGPEILTGSTRLKAGTATKLILNMFTTIAMVRTGKVLSNLMVDVKATNVKLRDRAVRIVCTLTGADAAEARTALERSRWIIKDAAKRL
jgi:N-acetylmuramic acid 6-phosphate etherase